MKSRRHPSRLWSFFVSFCLALLFCTVIRNLTFLRFPKQVINFKGDKDKGGLNFRLEFNAMKGVGGNIWMLEAVSFQRIMATPGLHFRLNGMPIEPAKVKGRQLFAEFADSLLKEGGNIVEINAETTWAFRRLYIRNIFGYSRGLVSAVVFHRTNSYPEARVWPRSLVADMVLILFFLLAFALNFLSISPQRFFGMLPKACLILGYLIPALFSALIILPFISELKVWLELRSVLILILLFYALTNLREIERFASRLSLSIVSHLGSLVNAGRTRGTSVPLDREKDNVVCGYLILCFSFLCLIYPGPIHRYGDSLEYCAMLVGWAERLTPRVTEESWALMEKRLGLVPSPGDSATFAGLRERNLKLVRDGREIELPHFWLYSLAASVFYWPIRFLSLDVGLCFMLLHIVLLLIAFSIVRRKLGSLAGLSLMLIIFCSPLLWFINKVHVEFCTVILAILGAALLVSEDWAASTFAFALASAQNMPFAIISALVFAIAITKLKSALFKSGLFLWLGAFLLTILQPFYYYLSLGVLNPVVATGGAAFGGRMFSLKRMTSFLIDPDIGLLPNWPLSLLLIFLFVYLTLKKQTVLSGRTWIFLIFSLPILLWSQSRTANINHGGTYNISRYALWYLYVFFLAAWQIGSAFDRIKPVLKKSLTWIGLVTVLLVWVEYRPDRAEQYVKPTLASHFLYDHFPHIYNPVPEIFIERYLGQEASPPPEVWAISNTSGSKICISRERLEAIDRGNIPPILTNMELERARVYEEAKRRLARDKTDVYFYINGLDRAFTSQPVRK